MWRKRRLRQDWEQFELLHNIWRIIIYSQIKIVFLSNLICELVSKCIVVVVTDDHQSFVYSFFFLFVVRMDDLNSRFFAYLLPHKTKYISIHRHFTHAVICELINRMNLSSQTLGHFNFSSQHLWHTLWQDCSQIMRLR